MTEYAIDYAWTHPSPAQLAALAGKGLTTVMRYLSGGTSKDLTAAEVASLHDAGLSIGLVWETTATRATSGSVGGAADARAADAQADRLGYPADCPIFYAVDFAGSWPQVAGYFAGVASATSRPVGIYGSASIVRAGHSVGIPYMWQTVAWSAGVIVGEAHLYQRNTSTLGVPTGCDENVIQHPFPRWEPDMTPQDIDAIVKAVVPAVVEGVWNKIFTRKPFDENGAVAGDLLVDIRAVLGDIFNTVADLPTVTAIADQVAAAVPASDSAVVKAAVLDALAGVRFAQVPQ